MPETNTQYYKQEIAPISEETEVDSNLEELRQILSAEQNRDVTYKEATDIGQSLIDFFTPLSPVCFLSPGNFFLLSWMRIEISSPPFSRLSQDHILPWLLLFLLCLDLNFFHR